MSLLAREGPTWSCDREERENTYPSLPNEGGYDTRMDAVRAWLPLAAEELGKDLARLEAAIAQTSGSDRWELERNRMYLDDQIFAELSLSKPNKWFLVYVWACKRSPE